MPKIYLRCLFLAFREGGFPAPTAKNPRGKSDHCVNNNHSPALADQRRRQLERERRLPFRARPEGIGMYESVGRARCCDRWARQKLPTALNLSGLAWCAWVCFASWPIKPKHSNCWRAYRNHPTRLAPRLGVTRQPKPNPLARLLSGKCEGPGGTVKADRAQKGETTGSPALARDL